MWRLSDGEHLHTLALGGQPDPVTSMCVAGQFVVTGSTDKNTVDVWRLDNGLYVRTLEGHEDGVTSMCATHDFAHVMTGSLDKTVRVWNLENVESLDVGCVVVSLDVGFVVVSMCVTSDGTRLVTGSDH